MAGSTQGPEIVDFRLDETTDPGSKTNSAAQKRIVAEFSPSVSVAFKAEPCTGKHFRAQEGQDLSEAFYNLKGDEKYVRLEIMAADGKKA